MLAVRRRGESSQLRSEVKGKGERLKQEREGPVLQEGEAPLLVQYYPTSQAGPMHRDACVQWPETRRPSCFRIRERAGRGKDERAAKKGDGRRERGGEARKDG